MSGTAKTKAMAISHGTARQCAETLFGLADHIGAVCDDERAEGIERAIREIEAGIAEPYLKWVEAHIDATIALEAAGVPGYFHYLCLKNTLTNIVNGTHRE